MTNPDFHEEDPTAQDVIDALRFVLTAQEDPAEVARARQASAGLRARHGLWTGTLVADSSRHRVRAEGVARMTATNEGHGPANDQRIAECEEALAMVEAAYVRVSEALRWYADPATYDHIGPHGTVKGTAWRLREDMGARARAALEPDRG